MRCTGRRMSVIVNGVILADGATADPDIPERGTFMWGTNGLTTGVAISDVRFTDLSEPAKK